MKNNNNSTISKISIVQFFRTHQLVIGQGFQPIVQSGDEPFRIIENAPVYVRGYNYFVEEEELELIETLSTNQLHKFGEYYDSSIAMGMPSVGGTIKLYVDSTSIKGWYLLWTLTKLDRINMFECMPTERMILAWTPKLKDDSIRKAGFRMATGHVLHFDDVEEGSHHCDGYKDHDYRIDNESSTLIQAVFSSIRDTYYKDKDEIGTFLKIAPDYLKSYIQTNAILK